MAVFKNLQEAEAALQPFIPSVAEVTGRDITLERMWPMMKVFDNPEKKLKVIHIAGTSGKTSTAYYLSALIQAAGNMVGLHVSPHIDKVTERTQLNGQPISDELFCSELSEFLDIIYAHKLKPSYFELHIAFAYWFFARQEVDYAVIETGMGGLHDCTNVAQRPDKFCILTDIGIDHTKFLGDTILAITAQKAGIIHESNTVCMFEQSNEIMSVVKLRCKEKTARLLTTTESKERGVYSGIAQADLPLYQQRNWLLAYFAYRALQHRDKLVELSQADLKRSQTVLVPARMEIKQVGDKTIVMDGAHNSQKVEKFVESFQKQFKNQKAAVLLSLKQDKDYGSFLEALAPIVNQAIITTFETSQELPVISEDPEVLADYYRTASIRVCVVTDHHEAYKMLLACEEELLVITGSFYLLYQIRAREGLRDQEFTKQR